VTTEQLFELVRDAYSSAMWDEDFPALADLDDMTIDDLDGLLGQLLVLRQTVDRLKRQTETAVARLLGEGGAARVGDVVYRYKPKNSQRVVDPDGLIGWLGADWHHVVPVTRSTTLRRGGLKAVCEQRGVEVATVEDTFLEWETGDPTVDRMALDRAPKFLQALTDGEIIRKGAA